MCKSLGKYVRSIFMVELFSLSFAAFHHFCDGLNRFRVCVFFFGPRAIVKRIFHQTCSPSKKIVHDFFFPSWSFVLFLLSLAFVKYSFFTVCFGFFFSFILAYKNSTFRFDRCHLKSSFNRVYAL